MYVCFFYVVRVHFIYVSLANSRIAIKHCVSRLVQLNPVIGEGYNKRVETSVAAADDNDERNVDLYIKINDVKWRRWRWGVPST